MKIMKKELTIIVKDCMNCDNKIWWIKGKSLVCREKDLREIPDSRIIPDWCPLEDYNANNSFAIANLIINSPAV